MLWRIACQGRASSQCCAAPHINRGDQLRIRTYERIVTNHCPVFVHAVVIAGDRTSADIDSRTNIRISKVSQMTGFRILTKTGIFYFNKITNMHAITESRPRPKAGIRADLRFTTHDCLLQMTEGLDPA